MSAIRIASVLAAVALGATGCYATATPPVADVSVGAGAYGYTPLYYEGNVVYYDDLGAPYYVVDGRPYYVPHSYPRYRYYTEHYHRFRPAYHSWYRNHQPFYRGSYRAVRPRVYHRR